MEALDVHRGYSTINIRMAHGGSEATRRLRASKRFTASWQDRFRLDHRNAFAIHGDHKQGSSLCRGIGAALGIEGVEMGCRFDQERLQAVIMNRQAGGFQDARCGFPEWQP